MKTKLEPTPTQFQPVTISFTFESQAELDAMGRLFNTALICTLMRKAGFKEPEKVHEIIEKARGVIYPAFHDEIREAGRL